MKKDNLKPIFIMGCQRSGTTMLGSLLAAAENSFALPELVFLYPLLLDGPTDAAGLDRRYERLRSHFRHRAIGTPYSKERFLASFRTGDVRDRFSEYIANYVERNGVEIDDERPLFWVEHSPTNRDYVEELIDVYPQAKFIHIIRDPRSTYISMKKLPRFNVWEPHKFCDEWIYAVSKSYLFATTMPDRVVEVRYEDILMRPAEELRRLCAFVGAAYRDDMLKGGGIRLPKFTLGQHALVNKPVNPAKSEEWRKELDPQEEAIIVRLTKEWMHHYGYSYDVKPKMASLRRKIYYEILQNVMSFYYLINTKITDLKTPKVD